jgi:plasmid stability protein
MSESVTIRRLPDGTKLALLSHAQRAGYSTLESWLRHLLTEQAAQPPAQADASVEDDLRRFAATSDRLRAERDDLQRRLAQTQETLQKTLQQVQELAKENTELSRRRKKNG